MATIQKYTTSKGATRWRVRWTEDGKRKSETFSTWKLAHGRKVDIEHSINDGSYVQKSAVTISAYLDTWIVSQTQLAPNTARGYKDCIAHVKPLIGHRDIQSVTAVDIESMYKKLSVSLSGTTVLYVHRVLRRALKQAERQRILNRNPCDFVDAPKKNSEKKASLIPRAEIALYLKTFEGHVLYPAVRLALSCGLRRGEVLGLEWRDIDWKQKQITISRQMTYDGPGDTKSHKKRTIPISDGMVEFLKSQREKQKKNMEIRWNRYNKSDYVVTFDDGRLINLRYLSDEFKEVLRRSKMPVVRFHDLRHTAGSVMIMEGVDLKTVSDILGHSSIKITADIYGHIEDEHKRDAVSRIDKFML